jgi:hypothetical protein
MLPIVFRHFGVHPQQPENFNPCYSSTFAIQQKAERVGWLNALTAAKEMTMLKITNRATADEVRWTLCGRLAGPWVAELRSNWEQAHDRSRGRQHVIDLSEVVSIDESGEELLGELRSQGAELVASGVYTRHLIENLKSK